MSPCLLCTKKNIAKIKVFFTILSNMIHFLLWAFILPELVKFKFWQFAYWRSKYSSCSYDLYTKTLIESTRKKNKTKHLLQVFSKSSIIIRILVQKEINIRKAKTSCCSVIIRVVPFSFVLLRVFDDCAYRPLIARNACLTF